MRGDTGSPGKIEVLGSLQTAYDGQHVTLF